jgi:hypothetical protein
MATDTTDDYGNGLDTNNIVFGNSGTTPNFMVKQLPTPATPPDAPTKNNSLGFNPMNFNFASAASSIGMKGSQASGNGSSGGSGSGLDVAKQMLSSVISLGGLL